MADKVPGKPTPNPKKKPATPAKKVAGKVAPTPKVAVKKVAPAKATAKPPAKPVKPAKSPVTAKPASKKPAAKKSAVKKTVAKPAAVRKRAPVTKKESAQAGLTDKQQRFVDEYLVDNNATQAAIRAKYSPDTAGAIGHENLKKPEIQAAIAIARKAQQERTQITADRVVTEAWNILTADARELVEVKIGCCRHCYGVGHRSQRTVGEMNADRERWLDEGKPIDEFDEQGGIGFNPLLQPHPECPECWGDGNPRTVLKDTRYLSTKAAALYAGAKEGKYGIEVQLHDKAAAMEKLFKHLGLYEQDNKQKTDPLQALLHRISNGSSNGFVPVQNDPESNQGSGMNSMQPQQDDGNDKD